MSLHGDLLKQAASLVRREPRRPKQASLRRAVSAAYYSLFHLLIHDAARMLVSDAKLRHLVARAFVHTTMKKACQAFAKPELPDAVASVLAEQVPSDLSEVARAFVDLQEARHQADYDLAHRFSRSEAQDLVDLAEGAFGRGPGYEATRSRRCSSPLC